MCCLRGVCIIGLHNFEQQHVWHPTHTHTHTNVSAHILLLLMFMLTHVKLPRTNCAFAIHSISVCLWKQLIHHSTWNVFHLWPPQVRQQWTNQQTQKTIERNLFAIHTLFWHWQLLRKWWRWRGRRKKKKKTRCIISDCIRDCTTCGRRTSPFPQMHSPSVDRMDFSSLASGN